MQGKYILLLVVIGLVIANGNFIWQENQIPTRLLMGSPNTANTSSISTQDCEWMTIDVFGTASLNVNPDIATINVQVTSSGKTTSEAITALSQKVNKILTTLTSSGLNSSNWVTNYLYVYDNTSYVNGTTVTFGKIAKEGMTITIPIPNSNGTLVGKIYDGLTQIKDITINGLSFDVYDKTNSFITARKLAYNDAKQRANDYLLAAGVHLGSTIAITDSIQTAPIVMNGPYSISYTPSTAVSVGKINIRYNINVLFTFKL